MPHVPDWITEPAQRNVDYVWFLDNDAGPIVERWFHEAGCRRWSTVHRDTTTDVTTDTTATSRPMPRPTSH
jgi:sarcosine oxidase, subunit delta